MTLLEEPDLGTPARTGRDRRARDRRPGRRGARGHLGHAGGRARRRRRPEAVRDRQPRGVRVLPAVPGRGRRRQGHARRPARCRCAEGMKVTHAERQARQAPPQRHGALHLRPPARLPDLPGQRRLRAAGHGRRRRAARRPLRLRRREPPRRRRRTPPTRTSTSTRASASSARAASAPATRCRARFALTISGRGFDSKVSASAGDELPRLRVRLVRRVRAGLPDVDASGEDGRRPRHADPYGADHVRLLRRRAARSRPSCAAPSWSGWCRTRTAAPTRATPA